ncbi:uncharacterized protein LOC141853757 [Brevipalpus obovatus]|uniref:uncharacterized protein LOC141853757 n=1 Tax=Brevipalpus obovatus TaxID=246614 RepID=UPI003D9F59FA
MASFSFLFTRIHIVGSIRRKFATQRLFTSSYIFSSFVETSRTKKMGVSLKLCAIFLIVTSHMIYLAHSVPISSNDKSTITELQRGAKELETELEPGARSLSSEAEGGNVLKNKRLGLRGESREATVALGGAKSPAKEVRGKFRGTQIARSADIAEMFQKAQRSLKMNAPRQ